MLIEPTSCHNKLLQIMTRGSDLRATDNVRVIPGWKRSDSSQWVHPTVGELSEVVSGGGGRQWR